MGRAGRRAGGRADPGAAPALLLVFRGQPSPDHGQLDSFFRAFGQLLLGDP